MSAPVVWVTGASRGIGRAIADRFAADGAVVALSARSRDELETLQNDFARRGIRAVAVPCNVTHPPEIRSAHAYITGELGPVDVLVNNAGISVFKPFLDTTADEFDAVVRTNLLGAIIAAQAVLPAMVEQKSGSIFNILSITTKKLFTNSAAYAASKAALAAAMDVLREELRGTGVRVVNVIPGATDTAIWPQKIRDKHAARMMRPEMVADAILMIYHQPPEATVEELVLRPVTGDL